MLLSSTPNLSRTFDVVPILKEKPIFFLSHASKLFLNPGLILYFVSPSAVLCSRTSIPSSTSRNICRSRAASSACAAAKSAAVSMSSLTFKLFFPASLPPVHEKKTAKSGLFSIDISRFPP